MAGATGTTAVGWGGAVLCGGRSRRMGRDKALLPIEGQPMAQRVALALTGAGATQVIAVGGNQAALASLGLPVVPDRPAPSPTRSVERGRTTTAGTGAASPGSEAPDGPGAGHTAGPRGDGPLAGIVTALEALETEIVLVVGCDLVAPSAEAMAATVRALAEAPDADVAVPPGDVPQWLHAAWRQSARDRLRGQLAAGERAVHRAVAATKLRVVEVGGVAPAALADADTPADLPLPVEPPARE